MKRLNKVLALVLAMVMMFGIVSVCASAADMTNAAYKVAFMDSNTESPTAISSAKAGQVVDIYISIKTNSYSPLFAFLAFYDATALTHTRQNATEVKNVNDANCSALIGRFASKVAVENPSQDLIDHEDDEIGVGEILDWGASLPTTTPHTDDMYPTSFTDAQKAQFKGVNFGYLAPTNQTVLTVNTAGEYVEMVRIRFIAQKDVTLDKNVFYLLEDPVSTYIAIDPADEPFSRLQKDAPVKVSNLVVEYATAGGEGGDTPAAPEAVVNTLPTQVQWKEADPTSGLMNVAFRGQIASGYDAVADKTGEDGPNGAKLASLSKVGVYLSVDGGAKTPYESQVIYNFTDGTYFFRVVVGNWAYNDAKELKAEAFIVIKGADGKDYEFKGSEITTSGTQEYTRATTKAENPMPEYAGA